MSRFSSLEFNHEFGDESREDVAKDEGFYYAEACTAFEQADFEKALRSYSKVLEFNPQNPAAWAGQVRALIELGEFREAKLWADKALEHFPSEPELLAAKAVALGRCGDLDGAMAFSDASFEERGDTPYIWLARGDILLARRERRADHCFDRALALAPRDWFTAWLAARVRFFYEQFALALKLVKQALEWEPCQGVLWLQLGLCQKGLGMVGAARESFARSLELRPRCPLTERALVELSQVGLMARLGGGLKNLFRK
jgi:tetratricopeptide (TPR) repeat protein